MYYFLGIAIPQNITGVDRAQYNRLKLFKKFGLQAKIITTQYHHLGYQFAKQHGLENNVLNMYDYFQKAQYIKSYHQFDFISYWKKEKHYQVEVLKNKIDVKVKHNGQMIIYARFFDDNLISPMFINHFNRLNHFVKHEEYDIRGFLSSISHYAYGNNTVYQEIFTPDGEKVIEKYYRHKEKDLTPTIILLKNKFGLYDRFDSESELVAHYLELITNPDEDYFIIDRPLEIVPAYLNMKENIPKAAVVIHMQHLGEINPEHIRVKWPYAQLFENLERFDALITSTQHQKNDIHSFIEERNNLSNIDIHHIPVGYINPEDIVTDLRRKKPNRFVSTSRYVEGKQLEDQIRIVHRLHDDIEDVTLDLYGFGSQHQYLNDLINGLGAQDYIKLKGYTNNTTDVYKRAVASLLTSSSEGFALSILESIAHCTPVFSYDINYGPNEIIVDNVNGNLIEYNNLDAFYESLKSFLLDTDKQQRYFDQCPESIAKYYEDQIIIKWKALLNH